MCKDYNSQPRFTAQLVHSTLDNSVPEMIAYTTDAGVQLLVHMDRPGQTTATTELWLRYSGPRERLSR